MKIAVLKPDHGIAGGFEALLNRLTGHLEGSGHHLSYLSVPAKQTARGIWGQSDAVNRWAQNPEFFNYLGMTHDIRQLELDEFDVVLSTQPPSYLAPHNRTLALFYHQARIYYDLADLYVASGFIKPELHRTATELVRSVDSAHLGGVRHWLAGSQECSNRITDAWSTTASISLLDAPPLTDIPESPPVWSASGPVLCVSRHEWPKRTELVVGAGHILGPSYQTTMIGGGGRSSSVRELDMTLTRRSVDDINETSTAASLTAPFVQPTGARQRLGALVRRADRALSTSMPDRTNASVRFLGRVDDKRRNEAYAAASVVIAPAYREDYGLTALEAMVWHKPVIVCRDGGGLVELVEATGAGLVVEPTASAIAEAVRLIQSSPVLAAELVEQAKSVAGTYTWDRAYRQLDLAVDQI